ncbi:MAG: hypothetical protein H6Q37_770 [Chloroflexi bacterium]|nr:hypothetical protein [Chloroflexota bacterium]
MDTTIQVKQGGSVTLPAGLCEKYDIQEGDVFRVIDLDGIFVLTPLSPLTPELALEIEKARRDADQSVIKLLQALRDQREKAHAGPIATDQSK